MNKEQEIAKLLKLLYSEANVTGPDVDLIPGVAVDLSKRNIANWPEVSNTILGYLHFSSPTSKGTIRSNAGNPDGYIGQIVNVINRQE